jgi:uncharacterized protein
VAPPIVREFRPIEAFQSPQEYRFLPFKFGPFDSERTLVTNDAGEFLILSTTSFRSFVHRELLKDSEDYQNLKAKHFLFDSSSLHPFELLATKYRSKKAHLAEFTKLHIFVVSLRCEHSCHYCQVSRVSVDKSRYDMSEDTARKALDLVFRSPAKTLKIEFQGGEPLLNFERVQQIVLEGERIAAVQQRQVEYVIASNLALLSDEHLEFCAVHNIVLSTSLDGPEFIHNAQRPRPGGNSYQLTVQNIRRARKRLGEESVAALMTTSKLSLKFPEAIIDEYVDMGFPSIFLRPLSPYGFAAKAAAATTYTGDEFILFYKSALDYILGINRKGTFFVESYAQLLLTRMLTPFTTGYVDLQSPAGIGIGAVVYNYDGDVYASDESRMLAEMGDKAFCLGNVERNTYEEIFGSELLRSLIAGTCIESIPGCADCMFQPYCGSDPVYHYAAQGDPVGHMPTSDFHRRNFSIIGHLFHLYDSDPDIRDIFWSWIRQGQRPAHGELETTAK